MQIRPGKEYSYEDGIAILSNCVVLPMAKEATAKTPSWHAERNKRLYAMSAMDLNSVPLSTACAAALLANLGRMNVLRDKEALPVVNSIERIQLRDTLMLSSDARDALAITNDGCLESGKGAQGPLTLFGLLDTTGNSMSSALLRRWFLFPSSDLHTLKDRHDAVSVLSLHVNAPVTDAMAGHLKGLKYTPSLLAGLCSGANDLPTWRGIFQFCLQALQIYRCITELEELSNAATLCKLVNAVDHTSLQTMLECMESTVSLAHYHSIE
ncbi:unnamed protein product [Sympodiomycopsis kandeliae]